MACSHSVVFLLDTASPGRRARLQRGALRLLNHLRCRFGPCRLRWAFRFLDSLGGRGGASRGGGFRSPGPRAWARFEEALAERLGAPRAAAPQPGPAPRAALTHGGLKETLLDFQWDRPEIASPAKPLRGSRGTGPPPREAPEGFVNAVFLFSPCPRSHRELRRFLSGSEGPVSPWQPPTVQELAEKLLPKSVQELMAEQKITLFWVDTAEWSQLDESPDHMGYWTMFELLRQMGGTILPSETLVQCLSHHRADLACGFPGGSSSPAPQTVPWTTLLPLDATLNCLFSKPAVFQAVFPQQEGTLFLSMSGGEKQESCAVILEPLAMSQRQLPYPVNIFLKGSLTGWSLMRAGHFLTESWILHSSHAEQAERNGSLFHQLLRSLVNEELYMVAEVSLYKTWCSHTAVLSPLSESTAVLTVLSMEKTAEVQRCSILEGAVVENCTQDNAPCLPDVVNSVLSKINTSVEDSLASVEEETPMPEWVQRELSHTGGWHPSVLEAWYPASNACGASSDLMESFRLLQVPCANGKDNADLSEVELSESLSELYQRKFSETSASGSGNNKKRRGVPRTPVRQKMKTMSRSLQMLNVARLNVKAQKFQPDGASPTVNEKIPQKLSAKRLDEKVEEKEKALKISIDFKTEEELQSHLTASYQKAIAEGVLSSVCAQSMIVAIKKFLKVQDDKEKEVACMERVRNHLLKTSKTLRQHHGLQKETKVRECRLQVFLRLELCLQCPSLQSNTDEMEQLLEEMTDMLRILCLTEDPGYLTKFLEEILELYMNSIPKTLGDIYYGLGTQIPPKLASVLPSDFFSDDSVTLDSKSPSLPPSLSSALTPSTVCPRSESDQLEELRTRSAKKRRNNVLARHRSMTEAPQNLRQIEIPKIAKIPIRKESLRSYHATEKSQQMALPKEAVQEVTKVRRNLFNEEILSPSKRSMKKMPRSQSVSAVEGLRYKNTDEGTKDHRKLLTKRVAETPLHKQVSRRLLHKQIKGRSSDPGCDTGVVEESPEKVLNEGGLRRSPRIKQLSLNRTCSGVFYCATQPSSQNSQQVHQGQEEESGTLQDAEGIKQHSERPTVQTPKRFFFGAVTDMCSPAVKHSPGKRRMRKDSLHLEELTTCQTPRRTPHKFAQSALNSASKLPRRSPRLLHRTPQKLEQTPGRSVAAKQGAAKCLGKYFSHPAQRVKSPSELNENKSIHLLQVASKDCSPAKRLSSPCKDTGLQMAEHEGFTVLNASLSPPTDSNLAASFSSTVQEGCFTELQTPRRSLRSLSKLASPVSIRRQILPKEIRVQSDPLSHATESTPRKPEGSGSKLCTVLSAEMLQFAVRLESSFTSPLRESSTDTAAVGSPSHMQARESDWELSPAKASLLKSPGITGTAPMSLCHTPKQAKCEQNFGGEKFTLACTTPSKNKDSHHDGGNYSIESLQLCQSRFNENTPVSEKNKQMNLMSQKSPLREDPENLEKHLSPKPSAGGQVHEQKTEIGCEQLNMEENSSANTCESFLSGSQIISDEVEARTLVGEECMGLRAPSLKIQSRFSLNTSPPTPKSAPAYSLRCTADRRQREAAARMGNPELPAKFSTSKGRSKLPSASPPTYEVELEMQASGLPKLRIKKIGSCSSLEAQPEASANKPKGGESPFGDLAGTWCSKHPGKLAGACVSPSCFRSFHNTPAKGGGQTYLCQSYTPTSCASNATSPSPLEAGVPWTPSPKQRGKTTPDAIKDWPRRKRAAGSTANTSCGQSEKTADEQKRISSGGEGGMKILEHCNSRVTNTLGEFELEGIYRLQDQASPSNPEPRAEEGSSTGTFGLKSRKRVFRYLSPEKEENHDRKRCCTDSWNLDLPGNSTDENNRSKSRTDFVLSEKPGACALITPEQHSSVGNDDVFHLSGSTPPLKSTLSASSLLALTQSPLLCQGQTPPSRRKRVREEESNAFQVTANRELSPFPIMVSRKRPLSRTYSRKRLLS